MNDVFESGSVIMAYWLGNGNSFNNINYFTCRVGVIQNTLSNLQVYQHAHLSYAISSGNNCILSMIFMVKPL